MDRVARLGIVGRANNVPKPLTPASDVATLSLFGYDPLDVYTGRAPLETAAMGLKLGPADWAVRCNLVTVVDGKMHDFTAGHITNADGARLMATVQEHLGGPVPGGRLEFHAGVQYRNAMLYRSEARPGPVRRRHENSAAARHPRPARRRPFAEGAGRPSCSIDLMEREPAAVRRPPGEPGAIARGERPATQIWLWGQGRAPTVTSFAASTARGGRSSARSTWSAGPAC